MTTIWSQTRRYLGRSACRIRRRAYITAPTVTDREPPAHPFLTAHRDPSPPSFSPRRAERCYGPSLRAACRCGDTTTGRPREVDTSRDAVARQSSDSELSRATHPG